MIELLGGKNKAPQMFAVPYFDDFNPGPTKGVAIYEIKHGVVTRLPDLPSLPEDSRAPVCVSFTRNGRYLAVGFTNNESPYNRVPLSIYKRAGNTFVKLPDPPWVPHPDGLNSNVDRIVFSPDGEHLFVQAQQSYLLKRLGDSFSVVNEPGIFLTRPFDFSYSFDGSYITYTVAGIPRVLKRIGDTYSIMSWNTGLAGDSAISLNGMYVFSEGRSEAEGGSWVVKARIFKRSGGEYSFLKYPSAIPTRPESQALGAMLFSPDDNHLAAYRSGGISSGLLSVYKWAGEDLSSTVFSFSTSSSLGGHFRGQLSYSSDNRYLVAATDRSPHILLFERSGDSYSRVTSIPSLPGASGKDTSFT